MAVEYDSRSKTEGGRDDRGGGPTRRLHVLYYDPMSSEGLELARGLRDQGFRVTVASSYPNLRTLISLRNPDVLVIEGAPFVPLEQAERVAGAPEAKGLPVVLVLGKNDAGVAPSARDRGFSNVLVAPFQPEQLRQVVTRAMAVVRQPDRGGSVAAAFDSLWTRYETGENKKPAENPDTESRFRVLFDHAADGLFLLGLDGTIVDVNARACARLGYEARELIGKNISTVEEREVEVGSSQDSLEPDRITVRDAVHICKDGERIPVQLRTSILVMEDGPRVLSSATDTRKQRALEEQVRQFQKMEAVGRFAGGIAHDLNNAVTIILSHAEFLHEEATSSQQLTDVEQIRSAARRVAGLTDQLLALSRDPVHESQIVDWNEVIGGLRGVLDQVALGDVDVKVRLARRPCWVRSDTARLTELVLNLIENARDAMPGGGVLLLGTRFVDVGKEGQPAVLNLSPGPYAVLTVQDDGVGMDAQTTPRVFEPFFTTKQGSPGLGLSVVYGLVNQLGGGVHLESQPDHGTTVSVFLPRQSAPSLAPQRRKLPDPGRLTGTETVLLVEDDDAIRELARRALVRLGYRALCAAHANEALALFNRYERRIDLLITDVVMPNMSGGELVRRLRALGADLPVLFMTGYTEDVLVRDGIAKDQASLLRKPFTPDVLARKVRQVIDLSRAQQEPAAPRALRVLVVDDDAALRGSLRRILREHAVEEAGSLSQARAVLQTERDFDVVLCDVGLLDGSGLDLHRWLAKVDPARASRLVFLTGGMTRAEDRSYVRQCGNRTLEKPFDVDLLKNLIQKVAAGL